MVKGLNTFFTSTLTNALGNLKEDGKTEWGTNNYTVVNIPKEALHSSFKSIWFAIVFFFTHIFSLVKPKVLC